MPSSTNQTTPNSRGHISARRSRDWFEDPLGEDLIQLHRIKRRVFSDQSPFQKVEVVETAGFGTCLVLDNRIQSCAGDEFIYHESLVHPIMISHPAPKTVLIAGGGEGATPKQALLHPSVTSVTTVDIDEKVITVCRENLPWFGGDVFSDPRFHLVIGDARKYIEECGKTFDVIFLDLPESLEGGPAGLLYTKEFYSMVKRALNPGGIITSQSDTASWGCIEAFPIIVHTMKQVFRNVRPYQSNIPSFGGAWGFCAASDVLDPMELSCQEVDSRVRGRRLPGLRYYDGSAHLHMFSLPRHLRQRMDTEQRVITDADPLAMRVPSA